MLQVRAANEVSGFVENDWIGRTVRIVGGHEILPIGGQLISPLSDMVSPH